MMVVKRKNKTYNVRMKRTKPLKIRRRSDLLEPNKLQNIIDGDFSSWSGQEITDLLLAIHDNYDYFARSRHSPEMTLYYHDLLGRLIKTYGH
jgi:hypothetical protein